VDNILRKVEFILTSKDIDPCKQFNLLQLVGVLYKELMDKKEGNTFDQRCDRLTARIKEIGKLLDERLDERSLYFKNGSKPVATRNGNCLVYEDVFCRTLE